jgi:hypothetical protein
MASDGEDFRLGNGEIGGHCFEDRIDVWKGRREEMQDDTGEMKRHGLRGLAWLDNVF